MTMRTQRVAFTYGFTLFIIWYLVTFDWTPRLIKKVKSVRAKNNSNESFIEKPLDPNIKYILQWTKPDKEPFTFTKVGQDLFFERRCPVTNCYVTWNRTLLSNVTDYHAILFNGHDLTRGFVRVPRRRSPHQKFVFVSQEPAAYYPVYHERYNDFFNMTWTYKLDSDVFYGYIIIRDKEGEKIGPKGVMHWPNIKEMTPINNKLKEKLNRKKVAAVWIVSKCHTGSVFKRALQLRQELDKYNMKLDIMSAIVQPLPNVYEQYYFYLSFETLINENYVTGTLLDALQHYTVPIVYGGANYSRFMAEGMYLNARTLPVAELAKEMVDIIKDKERYYDFFRWHNHYTYHHAGDTPETNYICDFCKKINDVNFMNQVTVINDFSSWWNGRIIA